MTQTNKVCIFAAPLCVAWSLSMCLVLALSHIKSPQPEVSEYAWALCYPPSPWHLLSPIYHMCAANFACTAHVHVLSIRGRLDFVVRVGFRARVQSTLTVHHAITGGRRARRKMLWRSR